MTDTLSSVERRIEALAGDISVKQDIRDLRGDSGGIEGSYHNREAIRLSKDMSDTVRAYVEKAGFDRASEFLSGVNKRHPEALWQVAHGAFPVLEDGITRGQLSLAGSSAWLKKTFPDLGDNSQFLAVHNGLSHVLKNPIIRNDLDSGLTREDAAVLLEYPQALQYAAFDVQKEFNAANPMTPYEGPYDNASLNNLIRRAVLLAPDVAKRNEDELRSVGFGDALDKPIEQRSETSTGFNQTFAAQSLPDARHGRNMEIV
ncbi:MAG: hypothetical protein U1E36_00150 [Rickettsiales bacterium]